ncbi:MAG: four helix bundle protein [Flavobacteriaceae bacterium]|nr:MAG: four helix bundle protein [Flavobacteriaceae bacterium]
MDYKELDVWKYSRELVKLVYLLTKSLPKEELYGLTNQIRRNAVSVPSNIAEAIGYQPNKEIAHFLCIARGSLHEILEKRISCKKLPNGFINYYKK